MDRGIVISREGAREK